MLILDILPTPSGVVLVVGTPEDEFRVELLPEEARRLAARLLDVADRAEVLGARQAAIDAAPGPPKRRDGPRRRLWGQAFRPRRAAGAGKPAPCPPASASPSAEAEA